MEIREIDNMLSKREAKYRAAIETSADGFWILDMKGRILEVNDVYVKQSGYSREELLSMSVTDLESVETPEETAAHIEKLLRDGHDRFETIHRAKNGSIWPVEIVTNYWPIDDGRIFVFIVDITERKKTTEHLHLMAKVFQNSIDAMMITDSHNIITNINSAFTLLTGYTEEDVIGKDPKILSAGTQSPEFYQEMWKELLKNGSWKGEIEDKRKDGFIYPKWLSIAAVYNDKNEIVNFIASFTDISERKRKEKRIKAEALRNAALSQISQSLAEVTGDYRATLDLIVRQVGVLVGDTCVARLIGKDGLSLDIAAAYNDDPSIVDKLLIMDKEVQMKITDGIPARVFETSEPIVIPVVNPEQLHSTYRPELWPMIHAISPFSLLFAPLRTQNKFIGVLILGRTTPDFPYTEVDKFFVQDLANRAALAIGSAQLFTEMEQRVKDRTEDLNRTNASLLFANRAKDSFLAAMSHEIRTPLSGMLGMLELLSLSTMTDQQRMILQTSRDSGKSLLRILNDILDWSKIEEGKLILSPRAISHSILMQDVVNTYSNVANTAGLTLWQHSDERISPAHLVDSQRISQILNNFVSNALKFTIKGNVEIWDELLEKNENIEVVRFSVKDTGIGISKEIKDHLFEVFEKSQSQARRMYGETGLGLAISKRLAELMGGRIEVESSPGHGSTFSLVLSMPVTNLEVQKSAVHINDPLLEHYNLPTDSIIPNILVVDDNPINVTLLVRQIEQLGLHSESAEDGKAAMALWRESQYSMVITDCHMPNMNGYELAAAIRAMEARHARPRIPIIACTANALSEENELCSAAGIDEVMVKPINLTKLQSMLSSWLPELKSMLHKNNLSQNLRSGRN